MSTIAIIAATVLGPILAVQVQKDLERWREEHERRQRIFKTLMATRANRLSATHIEALNLIDLEFPSTQNKFKKVRSAWRAYFAHLNETDPEDLQLRAVHYSRRNDLFTDLLYEMAIALGYNFDKTQISKDVYSTQYHTRLQADQETVRAKIVEILTGKAALPMAVTQFPSDPEFAALQIEHLKLNAEHLKSGKPLQVVLIERDAIGKVIPMRQAEAINDPPTEKPKAVEEKSS